MPSQLCGQRLHLPSFIAYDAPVLDGDDALRLQGHLFVMGDQQNGLVQAAVGEP